MATTTAPSEFTYDQTVTAATQWATTAEAQLAEWQRLGIPQTADALSTSGLDSGTMSNLADVVAAYDEAEKAMRQVMDHAIGFRDGLVRDHGAVNEAHQSAPQGGAEKDFYVER